MLGRISAILSYCCQILAAVGSGMLAILISYVVFKRFVWHETPHWAEELPRLILVWTAFVGGVVCSYRQSHLSAGLLSALVSNVAVRRVVRRVAGMVVAGGMIVLGFAGWNLAQMTMGQLLPALGVPAGWVYMALPVACAAMALVELNFVFHPPARIGEEE